MTIASIYEFNEIGRFSDNLIQIKFPYVVLSKYLGFLTFKNQLSN